MSKQLDWHIKPTDQCLVLRIVERSKVLCAAHGLAPRDPLSGQMDLIATHNNGCPLDFQRLLDFPDFDFAHDIGGIARHLDRTTGKLTGCFLPRCARPEGA